MAEEVVLLNFWVSPYAARVKIALAEKGIEYESKEEDISNKSPVLLEMNPVYKKIPVLIHKGKPISESSIIVQYVDEVWTHNSPLLPSDPFDKAQARFWVDFVDKKVHGAVDRLWRTSSNEAKEEAANELIGYFKLLEGEIGDKPYFGGETFGFVDITLIPCYGYFHAHQKIGKWSVGEECPKLSAWANRCLQRKSVSQSLCDPYKASEFVSELRKKLGFE